MVAHPRPADRPDHRHCRDRSHRHWFVHPCAGRLRDYYRHRADCNLAAAHPDFRRALGGGTGVTEVADQFPAAAIRLCTHDSARRIEGACRLPAVFARSLNFFVGAAAFIAAGVVCSATPAYWRNRRRKQPRARQARVERIDRQDARANDHFCRHRPTRNDASLTLYLGASKPLTGNNILQMRGGS